MELAIKAERSPFGPFLATTSAPSVPASTMPTPASAKGKGKGQRDVRRSRSRNTTPLSSSSASAAATIEPTHSPFLHTPLSGSVVLSDSPIDDIFDGSSVSSHPPSATTLRTITESVRSQLLNTIKPRGETCDRLMRELHSKKKERVERNRQREQQEIVEREAEERRQKLKVTPKKREREEDRPLAVGAHGIARQDGAGDVHTGTFEHLINCCLHISAPLERALHGRLHTKPKSHARQSPIKARPQVC